MKLDADRTSANHPEWFKMYQRYVSGGFSRLKPIRSVARKILQVYSHDQINVINPDSFFPVGRYDKAGKLAHMRALFLLSEINAELTSNDSLMEDARLAWFYVDTFAAYAKARNCSTAITETSEEVTAQNCILLWSDKSRVDRAFLNSTQEDLNQMIEYLNKSIYANEMPDSDEKSLTKCTATGSGLRECKYRICLIHGLLNSHMIGSIIDTEFFTSVLSKTGFSEYDLGGQLRNLTFNSQSRIKTISEESRYGALVRLLKVAPDSMVTYVINLMSMRDIRVHDFAAIMIPIMANNPLVSSELINTDNAALKKFHKSAGIKYLQSIGWSDDLPEAWFEYAITADELEPIYRKAVEDRAKLVGSDTYLRYV